MPVMKKCFLHAGKVAMVAVFFFFTLCGKFKKKTGSELLAASAVRSIPHIIHRVEKILILHVKGLD